MNAVSRYLFEKTGVDHRISSAYHPQTNGLNERTNQTLVKSFIKLSSSTTDWDLIIEVALYAYRISKQDSSGYRPFFLLYNCHHRKAIDHKLSSRAPENDFEIDTMLSPQDREDIINTLSDLRQHYQDRARTNIQRAQEKQKKYYDAKYNSHHVSCSINSTSVNKHYHYNTHWLIVPTC